MAISVQVSTADISAVKDPVIAICVYDQALEKQPQFAGMDEILEGALSDHAGDVEYKGCIANVLDVPTLGRVGARRILIVGLGPKRGCGAARVRDAIAVAARAAGPRSRPAPRPDRR